MTQTAWTQIEIVENGPAGATFVLALVEDSGNTRFSADADRLLRWRRARRSRPKQAAGSAVARGERKLKLGAGTGEKDDLEGGRRREETCSMQ